MNNKKGIITFDGPILCVGGFSNITTLTSIILPSSTISISAHAFNGCSNLTSVTIPNSVTSIEGNAFYSCPSLTSVTIPNSVTSIEGSAFLSCECLTSIVVEEGNTVYDSRENCNAIIETATNKLIVGCQNTTIPNSVTNIEEGAFSNCYNLISITIPNSVTSIGHYAFASCTSLSSVTIHNGVTSIGIYAFFNCSRLTSITYEGTQEQWNAITKGDKWKDQVPATYVQCIDGQVVL